MAAAVAVLQDDFGWADADWHRPAGWKEAATPHMMELLKVGVELDNMHAFKFCAPPPSLPKPGNLEINLIKGDDFADMDDGGGEFSLSLSLSRMKL